MNELPGIIENDMPYISGDEDSPEIIEENQDTSPDIDVVEPSDESPLPSTAAAEIANAVALDTEELRSRFPELARLKDIEDLPSYKRYSELRILGLTPEEAYLATRRRETIYDNRSHLISAVPAAASRPRGMSRRELGIARELFSDLSDSEIQRLYQKVTK